MDEKRRCGGLCPNVEAKPVLDEVAVPAYPTRGQVLGGEEPRGRRCGKGLAGAATFFLAISIGGCAESTASPEATGAPTAVKQDVARKSRQNRNAVIAAPLFEHGEGRGGTGCIVMTPPVFLSEEEAMQVIKEELGKRGIRLSKGGEFRNVVVNLPLQDIYGAKNHAKRTGAKSRASKPEPLQVDALNSEKRIAVEYVSRSDIGKLNAYPTCRSSAPFYDAKLAATQLLHEAAGKGDGTMYLGVFYDPMARPVSPYSPRERAVLLAKRRARRAARGKADATAKEGDDVKIEESKALEAAERKYREEAKVPPKERGKRLLRKQVADFAKWLEGQGVKLEKVGRPKSKAMEKLSLEKKPASKEK
jgi:hypothetical protein